MAKPINKKQVEQIARRMGYSGPMSKFGEFLMSSPKRGYAEGGTVKSPTPEKIYEEAVDVYTTNSKPQNFNTPQVDVAKVKSDPNQYIQEGSGQLTGPMPATPTATGTVSTAAPPTPVTTATYTASQTQPSVDSVVNQYQYATGTLSPQATVQGQMETLMTDLEDGSAAWADPAMRAATAEMNARGLGASSMAGAATTTAAMEAAIPIAMADAQLQAQMEMMNLTNEQQALMLANTTRTEALFTDVAAENAAKQFNATSENQTRQFNESLKSSVSMFNAEQKNAMEQFNAGQKNAMTQFRASMKNDRQKFNASNQLIVDQANAQWRQEIATINNANQNEANRMEAQFKMDATLTEMNAYFQERRDAMQYAYESGENDEDRAMQLLLSQMSLEETQKQADSASSQALWEAVGYVTAEFLR